MSVLHSAENSPGMEQFLCTLQQETGTCLGSLSGEAILKGFLLSSVLWKSGLDLPGDTKCCVLVKHPWFLYRGLLSFMVLRFTH